MIGDMMPFIGLATVILVAAAVLSFILLVVLLPLMRRYALAIPNARSSHKTPTPQGAGIGVVVATVVVAALTWQMFGHRDDTTITIVLAAAVGIGVVGAIDDIRPIAVLPRLLLQAAVVTGVLMTLSDELRIVPLLPLWFERLALGFAALWFVNLTNFMDGIDWITAAETIPITAFIVVIMFMGGASLAEGVVALALCGAMIGFAPLNKPVAKMFLGDVGSLAIGLLLTWMLIGLAGRGHIVAALLLPLYYLADATITLLRRLARGEKIWIAHRTHFYQRATQGGFTVMQVVARIFAVNIVLGLFALISIRWESLATSIVTLAAGAALVAWLLYTFAARRPSVS